MKKLIEKIQELNKLEDKPLAERMVKFSEEYGEFSAEVIKLLGFSHKPFDAAHLKEEMADTLIVLFSIYSQLFNIVDFNMEDVLNEAEVKLVKWKNKIPYYTENRDKSLNWYAKIKAERKKYYRVCNINTYQGLWYDYQGTFTGLIHNDFNFCSNSELKMDFDEEIVGWLSATDSIEELYKWFPKEDILKLQEYGWYIHEFEADEVKFYERFQHQVIKQSSSKFIKLIKL